jgi:hypothetical protein
MLKLCGLKDPTLKILATLKLQSKKMLISWSQIFAMRSWSLVFNLGWSTYINCWLMFPYASTWSHWIYVNLIKVFHWHSIILEQCIQKDLKSPGGRAMSYHSILGELSSTQTKQFGKALSISDENRHWLEWKAIGAYLNTSLHILICFPWTG